MQITVVFLVLVSGLAAIAMLYAISLLVPRPVERAQALLEGALGKSFLAGLINLLFAGALTFLLAHGAQTLRTQGSGGATFLSGILTVLAILIVLAVVVLALNGLAALATLLGNRLTPAQRPLRAGLWGSLLLVVASLTPYVGWFVFTPAMLCMGLGATIYSLAQRRQEPAHG
jgi:hypothetical protein